MTDKVCNVLDGIGGKIGVGLVLGVFAQGEPFQAESASFSDV